MTKTTRIVLACTLIFLLAPFSGLAAGKCATTFKPGAPIKISSTIRLKVERGFPSELLQEALTFWQGCSTYGSGFPRFVTEGEGDFVYKLRLEKHRHAGGYCAYIKGDEVAVFKSVRDANGEIHSCGSLSENLAHELGHLLDLADAGRDPACQTHLMGSLYSWKLDSKSRRARTVHRDVCRVIDERWLTWEELEASQRDGSGVVLASHP